MSEKARTRWQAAIEATPLTAIAADRMIYALAGIPEEQNNGVYIEQSRGDYEKNFDMVSDAKMVDGWKFELPGVAYDDWNYWGNLAHYNLSTPTGAGPYVWAWNGAATTALGSGTFEAADAVGAFQIPGAYCKSWELSGKPKEPIKASFDMIGQRLTAGHTMTAALSDRDLRGNYALFQDAALYLDDTAGAIGGTEVAASLLEFSIKGNNQLEPVFTGNGGGYYSQVDRDDRYLELSFTLLFDAATYAEFSGDFQSEAVRFGRLRVTNSPDIFDVNFHTKWEKYNWNNDGPTRKVTLMGQSIYDPTLGHSWEVEVTNGSATL